MDKYVIACKAFRRKVDYSFTKFDELFREAIKGLHRIRTGTGAQLLGYVCHNEFSYSPTPLIYVSTKSFRRCRMRSKMDLRSNILGFCCSMLMMASGWGSICVKR